MTRVLVVALFSTFIACGADNGLTLAEVGITDALPGARRFDDVLSRELAAAWGQRSPGYVPQSRYIRTDDMPIYINRLFLESSPYLQQHAHSPVNWLTRRSTCQRAEPPGPTGHGNPCVRRV